MALLRDGKRCRLCGFDLALNVHHIVPKAKGGSHDPSNLITLCPNHHALVHAGKVSTQQLLDVLATEQ